MEMDNATMNYQLGIMQKEIPNWCMINRASYPALCISIVDGNMKSSKSHDEGKSNFMLVQTVLSHNESGAEEITKNICEIPKDSAFFTEIANYDEIQKQITNTASEKGVSENAIIVNMSLGQYASAYLQNNQNMSAEDMFVFYNELYKKLVNLMIYNSFTVDPPSEETAAAESTESTEDDENAVIHAAVVEPDDVE